MAISNLPPDSPKVDLDLSRVDDIGTKNVFYALLRIVQELKNAVYKNLSSNAGTSPGRKWSEL